MSEVQPNSSFPDDDEVIFADEDPELLLASTDSTSAREEDNWKILLVDDEAEIHQVTKLALQDFVFDGRALTFLSAYSAAEASALVREHADIALILLDVVMETDNAGLDVVKFIRDVLKNHSVRIILRTGQPGQVPEDVVIVNYDINDYKTKTELTTQKLFTATVTALRAFRALVAIEASKQELEKIAIASARFVPREFLKFLQKESIVDAFLGDSVQADMTIMFADIRSFTSMSETLSLKENFDFINAYFSRVGPVIRQHRGFVDKYIGDAVMALFPQAAADAVRAAIAMQHQITLWNEERQQKSEAPVSVGIGLHTGSLMLGTVGEMERMESTVISDAVNLASRLEGIAKLFGAGIVISEQTLNQLDDRQKYQNRFLGRVKVKGKQTPVAVFDVYEGDPPSLRELKTKTLADFEQGVALYCQEQFAEALARFEQVLQVNEQDAAACFYRERCRVSEAAELPQSWHEIDLPGKR